MSARALMLGGLISLLVLLPGTGHTQQGEGPLQIGRPQTPARSRPVPLDERH